MTDSRHTDTLQFDRPATYRIRILGCLDAKWSDRVAGMQVEKGPPSGECGETLLTGRIRDQAQLVGLLNGLCEMRMMLLSVEWVPSTEGA